MKIANLIFSSLLGFAAGYLIGESIKGPIDLLGLGILGLLIMGYVLIKSHKRGKE